MKTVYKNGKTLRYGYTTGSCATAATKGSLEMLLSQEMVDHIVIDTPKGWVLDLDVKDIQLNKNVCSCAVEKDGGDDIDATNGMLIYSKVSKITEGFQIKGGIGVGQATKKGLPMEIGQPAINPVPLKMIKDVVDDIKKNYDYKGGISVEIYAPQGVEIAKRTFNPKLGILGGISIIGTTGIVEPMSEEAFKESLSIELKTFSDDTLVFAPGNYGRDYCIEQGIKADKILKISNFVGYMFERAVEQNKKKILFTGHIGKLIKVAGGLFHTHSRVTDGRLQILSTYLIRAKASHELMLSVLNANTTDEAVDLICEHHYEYIFSWVCEDIKKRVEDFVFDSLTIEVVLFSTSKGFLAGSDHYLSLMEVLK